MTAPDRNRKQCRFQRAAAVGTLFNIQLITATRRTWHRFDCRAVALAVMGANV